MRVDVWSDVVCPWCAIGKANLEAALAHFEHAAEVEVVWRSFELAPNAPSVRSGDYPSAIARRYGTTADGARQVLARITDAGAEAGLELHLERARPGNTFDAHRLLHMARAEGCQAAVEDRFMRAYLSEGAAIGERPVLTALAVEAGLDRVRVEEVLEGDEFAEAVRADEEEAAERDITGVPHFLLGGRFGVPGAQSPDTLLAMLGRAWDRLSSG
ncbi:MAG TPA: DsbA family oxidoreductase [Acidimicrobiales bacterium]|nr:DsbA family oxidoreductase [Acidimicrobiales bacterium]